MYLDVFILGTCSDNLWVLLFFPLKTSLLEYYSLCSNQTYSSFNTVVFKEYLPSMECLEITRMEGFLVTATSKPPLAFSGWGATNAGHPAPWGEVPQWRTPTWNANRTPTEGSALHPDPSHFKALAHIASASGKLSFHSSLAISYCHFLREAFLTFRNKWNSSTINFHSNLHFSFVVLITNCMNYLWNYLVNMCFSPNRL